MLNKGTAGAPEADCAQTSFTESVYLERRSSSSFPSVWKWVLRLCLPLLVALSVKALDWLWVDNIYGTHWLDIVGGTLLALGGACIAIWGWCEWANDLERP